MSTFPCTFTFEQKTEEPGSRWKPAKIKNRQSFPIQRVPFLEKRFRPAILTVKARRNHRKGTEHECEETVCDRQFPHGPDMAVAAARGAFNLAQHLPLGGPDDEKISVPQAPVTGGSNPAIRRCSEKSGIWSRKGAGSWSAAGSSSPTPSSPPAKSCSGRPSTVNAISAKNSAATCASVTASMRSGRTPGCRSS